MFILFTSNFVAKFIKPLFLLLIIIIIWSRLSLMDLEIPPSYLKLRVSQLPISTFLWKFDKPFQKCNTGLKCSILITITFIYLVKLTNNFRLYTRIEIYEIKSPVDVVFKQLFIYDQIKFTSFSINSQFPLNDILF